MDKDVILALLSSHVPLTPLGNIIFQYSLPPSLNSYGISFDKKMPGRISIRGYYEIFARDRDTEKSVQVTSHILEKIHTSIRKPRHIKYDAAIRSFEVHGNIFCIEFLLEDPSYDIIRGHFSYDPDTCSTCYGFSVGGQEGLDKCADCFGMGVEVGLTGDKKTDNDLLLGRTLYCSKELRDRCVAARRMKEEEIPDEEIEGIIYTAHIPIEYFLRSVFCAIHSGPYKNRVADHNRWEKEIRSLPIVYL